MRNYSRENNGARNSHGRFRVKQPAGLRLQRGLSVGSERIARRRQDFNSVLFTVFSAYPASVRPVGEYRCDHVNRRAAEDAPVNAEIDVKVLCRFYLNCASDRKTTKMNPSLFAWLETDE